MTDHYAYTASGKWLGILLASLYPTQTDLQRAKKAYERGCGEAVVLKKRGEQ